VISRKYSLALGLGLGLVLWVLFSAPWSPLAAVELGAGDLRVAAQQAVARPEPSIVVVDMDDTSLEALGEYPWPRRLHAHLVRKLHGWGARVIAFDVTFMTRGPNPAEDIGLRHAIQEAGNVVLGGLERDVQAVRGTVAQPTTYQAPFFEAANGEVSAYPDPDGAIRTFRLFGRSGAPTFDLAVLRAADPAAAARAERRFGKESVSIRFAGPPQTYPTVSYSLVLADVLDPRIDPAISPEADERTGSYADFFKDKIVLVGTSAPLLHDMFHTPFARGDSWMPGVEIHANAIDTLRRGDPPRAAPWWLGLALAAGGSVAAVAVFGRLAPSWGLIGAVCLIVAFASVATFAFRLGLDLPVLPPIAAAGLAWPAVYGRRFVVAEREKARIRATFSRYVAPRVVDEMLRHPDQLPTLRNERREITVLFTDIEGFTTFSETHPPDLVGERLNEVLSALTQVVFDHGGTLDKYIGDAVMAVWGNIGQSDPREDARRAVQAAIGMQRAMAGLRAAWAADGGAERLRIRIGIHSGEALVGNFGSPLKLDFTAIGDTVNTASRLEGLNKQFETSILVSGATAALVTGAVELRPLGESILKGKSTGTLVFEVPAPVEAPAAQPAREGVVR